MTTILVSGQQFRNGVDGLHAVGANWNTLLTVVKRDPSAYGATRYVVLDSYGRHCYALGKVCY